MTKRLFALTAICASLFAISCSGIFGCKEPVVSCGSDKVQIKNSNLNVEWIKTDKGWQLSAFQTKSDDGSFVGFGKTSGEYALIYADKTPGSDPVEIISQGKPVNFPEKEFKYVIKTFQRATGAVPMNRAGEYAFFYPQKAEKLGNSIVFASETKFGKYTATWTLNPKFPDDIDVVLSFEANADGFYSLPTPTIATLEEKNLSWGVVPGWYQGGEINKDFHQAYAYAQGLPEYPVICRESTITTMSTLMENKQGVTLGITPEPGQDRNAYEKDKTTHNTVWKIGLSHMNKNSELTPVAYHPVLGQAGSQLKKGEKVEFKFRISLAYDDWYEVYKHAIYDIYQLDTAIALKDTKQSLTDRVISMHDYLLDDKTSYWNVEEFEGVKIGAQSYLGGVHGADKDAMKNSDIGAAWMLANITGDPELLNARLKYMRNFKVKQQQTAPGYFQGAAKGQYYLAKKKIFTEEWGSHFEPIGLTYYTLMDLGNILLFEPNDKEVKDLIRLGADKLLQWQRPDGSWVVAYDKETQNQIYTDVEDLRPTFYGMVIAYRLLGDEKYLKAAQRGADWYVKNAVDKGRFLGVCGDVRFVNDFATGQSAQALLDLYEIDKNPVYLEAAKKAAKLYTTSIYTHPIPNSDIKLRDKKEVYDWQLNQVGLCFEHGGSMGSAVGAGPILLVSHCGMFVRMYELTGDKLYLDLARAGALGRDAFVNPDNHVASYYWGKFDNGPGPFPHHAWWQVGWIFDYLVSEAEMRSGGQIKFPRGFITPKVGPHQSIGFTPGDFYGTKANLVLKKGLVSISNPNVDYLTALSADGKTFFLVLMNDQQRDCDASIKLDPSKLGWKGFKAVNTELKDNTIVKKLKPFGFEMFKFTQE